VGSIPAPGTQFDRIRHESAEKVARTANQRREPQDREAEFLKKPMSDPLGAKIVLSRNVMYDDLRDLIITDYIQRRVPAKLEMAILPVIDGPAGNRRVHASRNAVNGSTFAARRAGR
jgi:hypothetical protein